MRRNLTPALAIGSLLALALLAANMALTVASTRTLRSDDVDVQHINDVRMALQGVLSRVKDAETGQRGFIITGLPEHLAPYQEAVHDVPAQVEALARLVAAEPAQRSGLLELRRRVSARLGELDLSVAARLHSGFDAATQIVTVGAGKAEMDGLRAVVARMAAEADRTLAGHEQAAERSYGQALWAGLAMGLAAMLGVVAFTLLLRRYVGERDRSEAALGDEAERFRTTLESIGDAVIATDLEGRITHINAVAETVTGWRSAEALGQPLASVFRIVDETTHARAASPAERALREGVVVGLANHTLLISKSGGERPIDDCAAPIRNAEGEVTGAVLVFRDISSRNQTERQLREADARLRRVVMEMAVPTMAFAEDGSIVFVNDAWVLGTGYSRGELRSLADWTDRAYPERAGFMRQHIETLFELRERVDSGERRVTTAGGETRLWHFYTAPIGRDASGRRRLVTNAIDVTERRQVEEQLRESEARLRTLLPSEGKPPAID